MELEPGIRLMAWQLRITNEPEMRLIAKVGKGIDQTVNATSKAAGVSIGVGAFKRKNVELHGGSLSSLAVEFIDRILKQRQFLPRMVPPVVPGKFCAGRLPSDYPNNPT